MRAYARWGLWLNFRKVYLEHAERVPAGGNVIFALNHPTAFLEPIAVGTHVDPRCWYMLRGDKFVNRAAKWLLHRIGNLPIWRVTHDGRAAVRGNVATMDFATDRVLEGEPTVILSEGSWSGRLRLMGIQRGTARMLFQAWRKDRAKPVAVVPVAANFTDPQAFRSSLTLSYGEPIYAADYAEAHAEDSRAAIDAVTAEIQRRLRELVIHVEERERLGLVERLLPLVQHGRPDSGLRPTSRVQPFREAQWRAAEAVNHLDRVGARALATELDDYLRLLNANGVSDSGVALPGYGTLARAAGLVALGPLAFLGLFLHYPPAYFVARRAEAHRGSDQFFASVRYGLGLGVFFGYALAWTLACAFVVGWWALLAPVFLYATAQFYLRWRESFALWRDAARVRALAPEVRVRLGAAREGVLASVGVDAERRGVGAGA